MVCFVSIDPICFLRFGHNFFLYQKPVDLPPGGARTRIVARGPDLSNSSTQQ